MMNVIDYILIVAGGLILIYVVLPFLLRFRWVQRVASHRNPLCLFLGLSGLRRADRNRPLIYRVSEIFHLRYHAVPPKLSVMKRVFLFLVLGLTACATTKNTAPTTTPTVTSLNGLGRNLTTVQQKVGEAKSYSQRIEDKVVILQGMSGGK